MWLILSFLSSWLIKNEFGKPYFKGLIQRLGLAKNFHKYFLILFKFTFRVNMQILYFISEKSCTKKKTTRSFQDFSILLTKIKRYFRKLKKLSKMFTLKLAHFICLIFMYFVTFSFSLTFVCCVVLI